MCADEHAEAALPPPANNPPPPDLARLGHDLRTPLNGILGYAQILLRDPDLTPAQQHGVTAILQSGQRLLQLINDALNPTAAQAPPPPAAAPAAARIVGYAGARRTALVVDDQQVNRLVLRQLLARIGFAVREADSGAAGVALAAAHPPDVVLLDLRMPEMDGFETAAALRRLPALADSCIIAVSAIAEQPEIDRSLTSGCDAFLAKPVQAAALLALLADHLQLTWQLADRAAETAVAPQPAPPAFLPPPPGDVQTLLDLARRGHLRGIHEHAAALAEQDTRYRPFAARLIALATAYDEAEILKLLEQFA